MAEYLRLLEVRNRTVRLTTSGSEVIITWYCEPASAAAIVMTEMLGGVTGSATSTQRVLPASDFYFPYFYCVACHEVPLDPRSGASSPPLSKLTGNTTADIRNAFRKPPIFDGPNALGPDGKYQPRDDRKGLCGAYIEAIYRPLSSIYKMPSSPTENDYKNRFDYVDPQFTPCSKTIDVASSLYVLTDAKSGSYGAKVGGSPQLAETWREFTIRRVMCRTVPWKTINSLANRINGSSPWTPAHMTVPGLPENVFPQGTLRFDYAEVTPRIMPNDWKGTLIEVPSDPDDPASVKLPVTEDIRWWDILLKFSWRTTWAEYTDVYGERHEPTWITWNCDWFAGIGFWGQTTSTILGPQTTGWYETAFWKVEPREGGGFTNQSTLKYLNAEDAPLAKPVDGHVFDLLFLQNSP